MSYKDLSSNFLLKIAKKPQSYGYTTSFLNYFYLKNFCLNINFQVNLV